MAPQPKTKLKGGCGNFWTEWKGSLKSSYPHWLKMVTMTLPTNKTAKMFYCLKCNKNSLENLG